MSEERFLEEFLEIARDIVYEYEQQTEWSYRMAQGFMMWGVNGPFFIHPKRQLIPHDEILRLSGYIVSNQMPVGDE